MLEYLQENTVQLSLLLLLGVATPRLVPSRLGYQRRTSAGECLSSLETACSERLGKPPHCIRRKMLWATSDAVHIGLCPYPVTSAQPMHFDSRVSAVIGDGGGLHATRPVTAANWPVTAGWRHGGQPLSWSGCLLVLPIEAEGRLLRSVSGHQPSHSHPGRGMTAATEDRRSGVRRADQSSAPHGRCLRRAATLQQPPRRLGVETDADLLFHAW